MPLMKEEGISKMAFLRKLIKCIFMIVFAVFCINYWLEHKSFTFSEESVAIVARKYSGKEIEVACPQIIKDLQTKFPGHILPNKDHQWIFMNAGGWMGSILVLHASITEYVLLFGTALDTTGHSGRYWANISDTLIIGSLKQWKEGELKHHTYNAGETVYHGLGEATAVFFAGNTWMLEYGRGFIPSTLGFALADTLFSTLDFGTLFYIIRVYTKGMVQEAVNYVGEFRHYVKDSL